MSIKIDCDFPGGNILVDKIEGDEVFLQQDQRDTEEWWFYWCFRIQGAAGRTLKFNFTNGNVLGVKGPAKSADLIHWSWVGTGEVTSDQLPVTSKDKEEKVDASFVYSFSDDEEEMYFCFSFRYVEDDLNRFLTAFEDNPLLKREILCTSNGGRDVEKLIIHNPDGDIEHRILLTARNHCCEMIASYAMEGVIRAILDIPECAYLRTHCETMIIPFADKDGVEQGDQGKLRVPRDHNRDYDENSIYAETRTIQEIAPEWGKGKLHAMFDLHCPHIRGSHNEDIYAVGCREQDVWTRVTDFCKLLEHHSTEEAPYFEKNNLPFGQAWNTGSTRSQGMNSTGWARSLPGMDIATTFEIPYAQFSGVDVTKERAREFGENLMIALVDYFTQSH